MEPENQPLEKEIPFGKNYMFRFHIKLGGVMGFLRGVLVGQWYVNGFPHQVGAKIGI